MSAALDFPASPLEGVARAADRSVRSGRGRARKRVQRVLFTVAGLVVFVVSVFPVYWMISTSFLPNNKIRNVDPTFAPVSPTLDNFRTVLKGDSQFPFLDALRVSLSVAVAIDRQVDRAPDIGWRVRADAIALGHHRARRLERVAVRHILGVGQAAAGLRHTGERLRIVGVQGRAGRGDERVAVPAAQARRGAACLEK